ncbi:hypothetical protein ACHAXA_002388 [Cyclostephanos tholiformis]|uniref:Heat shock protein 70 n=1 Tax=Cyclostephanos tholiformis TaxID=382380 RepID=A0ABD3RAG5_9STRA
MTTISGGHDDCNDQPKRRVLLLLRRPRRRDWPAVLLALPLVAPVASCAFAPSLLRRASIATTATESVRPPSLQSSTMGRIAPSSLGRIAPRHAALSPPSVVEIGVGVDLGTTNSAIATMIRTSDGETSRPVMIRIDDHIRGDIDCDDEHENGNDDDEGRSGGRGRRRRRGGGSMTTTIPSVVSLVPVTDDELDDGYRSRWQYTTMMATKSTTSFPASLFSAITTTTTTTTDVSDDDDDDDGGGGGGGDRYRIHVGREAEWHELGHPTSTYRNVKRVIGTGGNMAYSASGVVPNLFVRSIGSSIVVDGDGEGGGDFGGSDGLGTGGKGERWRKKTRKGKRESRASSSPNLRRQLEDARDDPALLTCRSGHAPLVSSMLRPEQISACVLRRLYDAAERDCSRRLSLGGKNNENDDCYVDGTMRVIARVTRAVIGVPAYFTESQRAATLRASELAGVSKVRLLAEPEAAALAYHYHDGDRGDERTNRKSERRRDVDYDGSELILVFDLGGGTFDVSILEVGGGVTEVLATMGNNRLGGTDFDSAFAEYICERACEYGRSGTIVGAELGWSTTTTTATTRSDDDQKTSDKRKIMKNNSKSMIKNWYRHGSGDLPNIIVRLAERVRICLSNQKAVDIILPLTEDCWRRVFGTHDAERDGVVHGVIIGPHFEKSTFETERGLTEGDDYIIVTIDRKAFESACVNELKMLLKPLREVAVMARVMLPGDARPSFVENVMADLERSKLEEGDDGNDDGEDNGFWGLDDDETDDKAAFIVGSVYGDESPTLRLELPHNERVLQRLQEMNVKSQKKAQQCGRKRARSINKRERSFRNQKQVAMENAVTASLLGKRPGRNEGKRTNASLSQLSTTVVGNERVQDGIHGRPLSRVILVGGATRMPVIGRLLEVVVGVVPQRTVNPDEAVALGCAVQVGILDGENDGQAVLSPMQAAVMRALAVKKQRTTTSPENGIGGIEEMMAGGGGVVSKFDDEDDFY